MAAELAETDRVRRDLVANVSHELRTPITALQAVLENLVDGVDRRPTPRRSRRCSPRSSGSVGWCKQLLDLSRLESGAVPLERTEFGVEPMLEHAVREQQLHAPEVAVSVSVDSPDLTADGDPERVHQVVANLVENAVRHSPRGGSVEVRARRARRRRDASRCSTKAPASPRPTRRASSSASTAPTPPASSTDGGAGLGLAIARWIVDLHGGDIHPERREPHGCRMVVTLPGHVRAPRPPAPTRPDCINEGGQRCRSPPSTKP